MAFWNQTTEPLRQNRWYISFDAYGDELLGLTYALKSVSKPEFEITSTEHTLLTQTFRLPGLLKWKPITLTMVATSNGTNYTDKVLMNLLTNYRTPENFNHQTIGKADFSVPIIIHEIKTDGDTAQKWELYNPLILSIKFGDLSYDSEDLVNISLTISYDYAKIITGDAAIPVVPKPEPKPDPAEPTPAISPNTPSEPVTK